MDRRDVLKLGAIAPTAMSGATAEWKPALFDTHQNDTVIALADLIIPATDTPGAKAALVNRHMDKLLHDGPADRQEAFLQGLAWLDGVAIRKHSQPFVKLTPAEQTALLELLDSGPDDPELAPGRRFFRMAKGFTSSLYYSTEAGFKELNKGGRVPATFGCTHSEHA